MTDFGYNLNLFFPTDGKNFCIINRSDFQGFSCYMTTREDFLDFAIGRELLFNQPAVYFLINDKYLY